MTPLSGVYPLAGSRIDPPAGSWVISQGIVTTSGRSLGSLTPGIDSCRLSAGGIR